MNSFGTEQTFTKRGRTAKIHSFRALQDQGYKLDRLPFSLRILLENLLRFEGRGSVEKKDIEALLNWQPKAEPSDEIAFTPARTLLQDFTGVPCVVDLAAMRDAMKKLGGDPKKINPLSPVELVIDHSVQVDAYGSGAALMINRDLEFERNQERYEFLKWGQTAFDNFKAVPPNMGIVHQVNLEYLARVVFFDEKTGFAYPDTLVGTDSHTTMVNGLGVLGWGVGGIEAEAAMLGQPVSMLLPQVVGFRLTGALPEGATATDLVLTVTEMLRKKGVVGMFVEFYGPGLANMPVSDRATIANMAPEYGATCGIFPVDEQTLAYLQMTGRPADDIDFVEAYMREQGLFRVEGAREAEYSDTLELDMGTVVPSVAGPKRPQDRIRLSETRDSFHTSFNLQPGGPGKAGGTHSGAATLVEPTVATEAMGKDEEAVAEMVKDGSVVIAAITSCTNTSNVGVMMAAGLLAKKAVEKGLVSKPWVKTSLAPGSRVVTEYYKKSGLLPFLEQLGFHVVGYGCTTCIGNSGPLPEAISKAVADRDLVVASVLSGNRNFEGRINQDVKANYLMSPPLVVAYALAGTMDIDLQNEAIGKDPLGNDVFLRDIWPSQYEVASTIGSSLTSDMFKDNYNGIFEGDEKWQAIQVAGGETYDWPESTYVKHPPYFDGMSRTAPDTVGEMKGLRVLAMLGDSITTDHISPAGSIKANSPAGKYLTEHGVRPHLFNSYGSRRGNHEVMVRGTFANVRLRNQLAPGTEGGFTTYLPTGEVTTIFEASEKYIASGTPLMVIAGKEYGSGSSRDWAAKGPMLLGVKVVIAESYERIHRSNLIGMGILPLQFLPGESAASHGLTGHETFEVEALPEALADKFARGKDMMVRATDANGKVKQFVVLARLDTPQEMEYYRHGGILQYVLRSLV